jgi:diketogulonate reductase-like aldo/keto reductase
MTRLVTFADGTTVPALGQGTWEMGDDPAWRDEEQQALARGIDLGLTLIDTAELYGDGRSERLVGEVIAGRRDEVFLVSKVRPENASEMKMMLACEKSLERLGTDRLDLYLLHWEGNVPLEETVAAFQELVDEGMIARWGVSNLDLRAMERLMEIEGAEDCAVNQLLYNLGSRGVEFDLLPWMQARDMPMMAYSPLGRGELLEQPLIRDIANRHAAPPGPGGAGRRPAPRRRHRHPQGQFRRTRRGQRRRPGHPVRPGGHGTAGCSLPARPRARPRWTSSEGCGRGRTPAASLATA